MFGRILLAAVAAARLAIPLENEGTTLTNADIAAMVKAGLADSTIVRAIELAAERGTTRFDTSPQALIELKHGGATASILDTMIEANAFPRPAPPSTAVPGLPAEQGVYYRDGDRWVELPSVVVWPEINTKWRGMTAIENRRYVLAGSEARLRVQNTMPVFHLRGMEPRRVWNLIRVERKGYYREWRTVPTEVFRFARTMQPRAGGSELEVRAAAHDVLELRPATALQAGEYALTMLVPGQRWLVVAFEFAVAGR